MAIPVTRNIREFVESFHFLKTGFRRKSLLIKAFSEVEKPA